MSITKPFITMQLLLTHTHPRLWELQHEQRGGWYHAKGSKGPFRATARSETATRQLRTCPGDGLLCPHATEATKKSPTTITLPVRSCLSIKMEKLSPRPPESETILLLRTTVMGGGGGTGKVQPCTSPRGNRGNTEA